jgi:DNA modification methylase/superfamily II DNA or RNA helicase
MIQQTYAEFLDSKIKRIQDSGFQIEDSKLNSNLFDFQRFIVKRALKAGRYAIFADCGLGKTLMQLEFAYQVTEFTKSKVLILAPLAVKAQTISEANKFGVDLSNIDINNYEQLENIDVSIYSGIVLDESSILKNFTGVYKNLIIDKFKETKYKLACTATPSPNDLNEIGNHSEFLNVLDSQDMRSRWFVRDEGMNNYRLKGHAKKDFFGWVASWSTMICNPSDLGFNGNDYVLPELNFIEKEVKTKTRDSYKMFNDVSVNATNFNQELRLTKVERLSEVVEIVNNSKENFIIWVKQNEEADYLKKLIPDAKEVRGNDSPEIKEKLLLGFGKNEFRVLITKSKIAQFGLNYQNCHNQIFASLDFSFESLYQSIRRSYRFGQKNQVNIYLITTDTMQNVINTIKQKEAQFLEMQSEMNKNINSERYGLLNEYEYKEFKNNSVFLMKGDTNIEIKRIPDNSIDLIIFSPPFSSLFTYSNYIHDMGNNESHADFFKQYEFLLKELYRILKPGRIMACHTKDLGVYKNSSGYTGMYDFTGEHNEAVLNMIPNDWANDTTRTNHKATENAGFKFHSKITIWCDPVLEMQRTKTQRLLYKTVTSDSTKTGIGMAEYVTIFKKWDGSNEENWEAVTNLNKQNFPLDTWQKWASPVWMDIKRTDVLNGQEGTAMGDEKHIAPLQLEVIHRIVNLWSNEGETIFTPFLGIGSEAYVSVKNNRKAIGCELKDSYFDVAVKNCTKAESLKKQISMHL